MEQEGPQHKILSMGPGLQVNTCDVPRGKKTKIKGVSQLAARTRFSHLRGTRQAMHLNARRKGKGT